MRTGRPIAPLSLIAEQRERLEQWARRPKTARKRWPSLRELVLACTTGHSNLAVASKLRLTHQTVGKWRQRFWRSGWRSAR